MRDWRAYPTSDLDLWIYWNEGYNLAGATGNSPERAILEDPKILYVLIDGHSIYGKGALFTQEEPHKLEIRFTLG